MRVAIFYEAVFQDKLLMPRHAQINLFVTCTSTKRFLPTGNIMLREVAGASLSDRFSAWKARIERSRSVSQSAVDTYYGGHWSVVRSLIGTFQSPPSDIRIWIVSAGYGLISPSDAIIPYGATFTPGQADSVYVASDSTSTVASIAWWKLLSEWRPSVLQSGSPRSVAEVVSLYPQATNLLVLPPDYFRALSEDLSESLTRLGNASQLIILSSDEKSCHWLADNTIKIDARLQSFLGGARSSLGIRMARTILQELHGKVANLASARQLVAELIMHRGVTKTYDRAPVYDARVMELISEEFSRNPSISYSQALRNFRDAGFACEMKRFRRLFAITREQRTASLFAKNRGGV